MSVKYNNETIAGKYKTQIIDTSKFATKDEVNDLLEEKANTSDIPDVSNFITMTDVKEKGYLTQIELDDKGYAKLVDIQGKADASTVNEQLELKADKSTTYTKSEVDDKIADAVTGGQIDLSGYAKDGEVVHLANSETITGSKTFTQPLKIQNGAGTGSLLIGGDVNAGTVTNGARKLARIAVPTQANKDLTSILLGFDSNGDDALSITNRGSDNVSFGGSKKITNATSPMSISFCVAKERNATDASKKTYALEMDANEARFNSRPNYNGVNLATTVDVTNALGSYAKLTDIPDVSNYITMNDVEEKGYLTEVPSEYITETELNNKGYLTEHQDISNLATKTELTEGLATKQPTGNYALKTDIPDISNLATKEDIKNKQSSLNDTSTIDVNDTDLTVIGVQSKSGDVLYDWIGTKEEYETGIANGSISEDWICWVTDDEGQEIDKKRDLFDIVQKDHILSYEETFGYAQLGTYVYSTPVLGTRYGYPTFYNKCVTEKQNSSTSQVTLGSDTITIYVNSNGHQYYDISDKDIVDTFYEATGIAWFYGVDTENRRIFLPRNDYLTSYIANGEYGVHGNGKTIGLTDGTKLVGVAGLEYSDYRYIGYKVDYYGTDIGTSAKTSTGGTLNKTVGLTPEAENSGIVTDITNTQNKLYSYMVVGNTANEEALTDVIDITTTENDTLPLFYNTYSQQDMTSTGAFVNASLGAFLDGKLWSTAYTEIEKMGIGAKFDAGTIKAYGDSSITDFDLVLNQSNMTFRLPLKNGQEIMFATGVKGNGITVGWTDGTNLFGSNYTKVANNYQALTPSVNGYGNDVGENFPIDSTTSNGTLLGITTDSTKSGIELDTENITIPEGWNLYYKVANAVQNAQVLDVAKITDALNKKVGIDNLVKTEVIVETYINGNSWYRVWSDNWCEQGGKIDVSTSTTTISLLKEFKDNNYTIFMCPSTGYAFITSRSTDSFVADVSANATVDWRVQGYIS